MINHLRKSIEMLRNHVNSNLAIIHKNEAVVRQILQNEPVSVERSAKLDEKFNENKKFLEENHEAINLQLSIIKYIDKYKPKTTFEQKPAESKPIQIKIVAAPVDKVDYFALTISGEIEYNETHPMFHDEDFYNKLMDHYTQIEDYEMCGQILSKKN
jgi:hypothetical protein